MRLSAPTRHKWLHHVFGAVLSQHRRTALGVHEDLRHVLDVSLDDVCSPAYFSVDRGRCEQL